MSAFDANGSFSYEESQAQKPFVQLIVLMPITGIGELWQSEFKTHSWPINAPRRKKISYYLWKK